MPKLLEKSWPWAVAAGLAAVLAVLSLFVEVHIGPQDEDPRPVGSVEDIETLSERPHLNVLFILIDTLRADHLSAYGYERDTSPEIARIAGSGVRFAKHLSQSSWTKCSMASLWTSMYPSRTGVTRFDHVLPEQARMPAEILKDAGFHTVGIYRNGWVAPTFGFEQGFDTYMKPAAHPPPLSVRLENPTISARGTDEDVINSALEFLRVYGDERWFLYLHLMDVHEYTYDDESALFGGEYADIYDNAIRWTDGTLHVFFEYLAAEGYLDDTLVVISSDHGEAFRERGLEGHARRVYRETTEVPFIISFPFKLDPGVVVGARSRNVDVWPTILDLLGLKVPDYADGRSLVPDLLAAARGEPAPDVDRRGFAQLDQHWGQRNREPLPTVAVVDGDLRYVRSDERGRRVEVLFDASRDPKELDDRSAEDPEDLARLRGAADAYLESKPPWGDAPKRDIGELELNQLRALGYALP